ncbi:MAG: hydroxymethylglutaryl-CoA synthase [Dehalococcoidia bacterium]|nr:hydroxymethylglutaryl-CoA synthase [Dehalococcoidia bacterium]
MVGIKSYGAYIPYYRLERSEIAKAWGGFAMNPGEKAVANHDEDSITMAVEAAFDCLKGMDGKGMDGLFFASTTSPYREKQCSSLIATVMEMGKEIRTADFADCLRAGTTAIRGAIDAIRAGPAKSIVVVAADCRLGYPYSQTEQSLGDGAAALLLGDSNVIATIEDCCSISDEITDVWRTDEDTFVREWEDRWVIMHGYSKNVGEAVAAIMQRNGLEAKDFAKAVVYGPDPRSHGGLMRRLGFEPAQVQDTLFTGVGNTGTSSALIMLVATLEEAKGGDRILLASYGDGADAFILTVTEEIEKVRERRGVKGYLASKAPLPSYGKYLVARRLVQLPPGAAIIGRGSATVMWRTRDWVLGCHASKCRRCGLVTYPIQRVCYGCQSKDDYDEISLSQKKGKVFTFSLDNLAAAGINPPIVQTVVDFEEGARLYCMMTDCDPQQVKVDMPVEMTFRRLHEFGDFHNYFWKCRPIREG